MASSVRETSGIELSLFADAHAWKRYFGSVLRPYIGGDVLEVGGGIGETTPVLWTERVTSWTAVEPARDLYERLASKYAGFTGSVTGAEHVAPLGLCGTIQDLPAEPRFDTVIYVDVLEHIPDDTAEVRHAMARLRPGGRLVTLSPAHGYLMSEFDAEIGHHRRYNRKMVSALTPPGASLERVAYLDSVGMALSLANRLIGRQSLPTKAQIDLWNRWVVPVSRVADRLSFRRLGKSIAAIWRVDEPPADVPVRT